MTITSDILIDEYSAVLKELGDNPADENIVVALTTYSDWTMEGATTIVTLARIYGISILRNACALAAALEIEDGSSGL